MTTTKDAQILQKIILYLVAALAVIFTPVFFSYSTNLLVVNVAHAAPTCGLGDTMTTLPNGDIQCAGLLSTITYHPDGTSDRAPNNSLAGDNIQKDSQGNVTLTPVPTSCDGVVNNIMSPITCSLRFTIEVMGAAVIKLSVWFLTLAGGLFNILVNRTIIGFGSPDPGVGLLTKGVVDGINTAWSAFRDLANILIIGFFTFIAVNIILGSKMYGDKRLIARVLIIAILINFSLLFAKIVIDFSNYTATQFYNASANLKSNTAGTQVAIAGDTTGTINGISGQLIDYMGVTSFAQTKNGIHHVQEAQDSMISGILYSVASVVVLLAAAAVLFYGCFILASRAILLVFLMITASLAFASYLIPALEGLGWKRWWYSLVESAVLAPLLMLFLWATLVVAQALKISGVGGNGSLGDLMTNPTNVGDIGSLFSYIIILGLLFATFKVSSSFSSKIAGFSYARNAAASPFTFGSKYFAAPILRRTAGLLGARYEKGQLGEARNMRDRASRARLLEAEAIKKGDARYARKYGAVAKSFEEREAQHIAKATRGAAVAGSRMNIMDTKAAQAIAKAAGVSATGASERDTRSYAQGVEDSAKAAEKMVSRMTPAKDDAAVKAAADTIRNQRRSEEEQLEASRNAAKATADQQKQSAEELLKTTKDNQRAANTKLEENQKTFETQIAQERQNLARQNTGYSAAKTEIEHDESEKSRINTQFTGQQREIELKDQADRIERARVSVHQFETQDASAQVLRNIHQQKEQAYQNDKSALAPLNKEVESLNARIKEIGKPVEDAEKALDDHKKKTEELAKDAADKFLSAAGESMSNVAELTGKRLGGLSGARANDVGDLTKSMYKKKQKSPSLHELLKRLDDENKT